jgi:predicted nucleic acid-binding protein
MQAVLLDTSIYINAWRAGEEADSIKNGLSPYTPVWLSAVVLEELYAGASRSDRHVIERLERDFGRVGRILVPSRSDWVRAGQVLAQLAARYGYERIGRQRLTNDALIAMSATRQGITVVTANERDFGRLARFRPFRYEVRSI